MKFKTKSIKTILIFIFITLHLNGCSESNGVDYMDPSPQSGFSTNKQVFAAQYSVASKKWSAQKSTLFTVPITVKNVSASAWSSQTEERPVRLSYHWLDLDKKPHTFEGMRTSLPKTINPGEQQTINVRVKSPEQQGQYILQVTMIQEGVDWFERQYVTPLELKVNID